MDDPTPDECHTFRWISTFLVDENFDNLIVNYKNYVNDENTENDRTDHIHKNDENDQNDKLYP